MATYLDNTPFSEKKYYSIEISSDGDLTEQGFDKGGVTVYSECCGDTMSVETARKVHAALGLYLAALDA